MSKRLVTRPRRTTQGPSEAAPFELRLTPDAVAIQFGPAFGPLPGAVALLIDGGAAAVAQVSLDGAATLPFPPLRLGRTAQVASVPDGRVLLPVPLALHSRRGVHWLGWGAGDGRIAGSFRLAGDLAPVGLDWLPVSLLGGDVVGHCFAWPEADGVWRFDAPVPCLARMDAPLVFTPEVAGLAVDETLSVTARQCGFAGHIDPTDGRYAEGWAVNLAEPARPVEIELTVEGVRIWRGAASQMRADIKALGLGDGRSAFHAAFPKRVRRDIPLRVAATVAGTGTHLVNSPYVTAAPPRYIGYFDALEGPFAGGWAIDVHDSDAPLHVEAVCEGEVIGQGTADLYRGDVEKAGMPTARCGFRFLLERPLAALFDRDVHLRICGTDEVLQGSPRQISQNGNIVRFLTRAARIPAPVLQRLSRRMTYRTTGATVSIVMPVYNTRQEWLLEALNSVMGQWSANWELICVDDGSTAPHVRPILDAAARHDPRIRVMRAPGNLGIARATNFGLRAARGEYVAFMDHDDVIEPDAVYKLAQAAKQTGGDLIYSDEAITTEDIGSIIEVRARPAFSYDYYLSHPYFVHMACVRTEIAQRLGGWDETLPISADVDFILRVIEQARVVTHVPSVLYRWRTHGESAGHAKQAQVTETMTGILARHLRRQRLPAAVGPGFRYNEYRLDWPDDGGEVLVVIPTKNRVDLLKACIDSIERTAPGENYRIVVIDHDSTDKRTVRYLQGIAGRHTVMPYSGPFNYARMNNLAVKAHGGDARYYLFLNNDVEAREGGWISRLRSLAGRPDVGAVGPLLLYGDDRVQHAGVLVGFSGAADHAMKFQDAYLSKGARHPGYNCNLTTVRDYSAVTAACVMVSRAAWRAVKGFDEGFVVGFNDTDLCLRIGEAGFKVLYDGFTVLYHHESATRTQSNEVEHPEDDARLRARWGRFFREGDPFYSPLLAARGTDHTLRQDGECAGRMMARAIALPWTAELAGGLARPPARSKTLRRTAVLADA